VRIGGGVQFHDGQAFGLCSQAGLKMRVEVVKSGVFIGFLKGMAERVGFNDVLVTVGETLVAVGILLSLQHGIYLIGKPRPAWVP
jgi:hypothetical protein